MKPILRRPATATALLAALGLGLAPAAALAQASAPQAPAPASAPGGTWMSVADLAALVEGQGYTLREVERDDGVFEVKMVDAQGYEIEAHLDPATGARLTGPRWDD